MKISIKIFHVFILIFTMFYGTILAARFNLNMVDQLKPEYNEKMIGGEVTELIKILASPSGLYEEEENEEIGRYNLSNEVKSSVIRGTMNGAFSTTSKYGDLLNYKFLAVLSSLSHRATNLWNTIKELDRKESSDIKTDVAISSAPALKLWNYILNEGMIISKDSIEAEVKRLCAKNPRQCIVLLLGISQRFVNMVKILVNQRRNEVLNDLNEQEWEKRFSKLEKDVEELKGEVEELKGKISDEGAGQPFPYSSSDTP